MKWETLPLASLGIIKTGSTPSTTEARFWEGGVPFVTPSELDQRFPITLTPRTLTEDGSREGRILQEGAVMVCCIGSLGKIGIAGRALVTNQQINSIEFDTKRIYPKYGYYACQRLKPKLISMAPATTVPIVNKSKFGQLEIPVPPLPEQIRIAAILDQADALRVKRREALAQLDSLKQSIFIEMFGELSTNSKGWKTCTVGDISDCIVPGRDKPKSFSGNIPWVKTDDLKHLELTHGSSKGVGLSESEIKEVRARVIPSGSVIISCVGDLGIVSIADIPMVVNQQLHSYQCHNNFSNIFLMYCLALQKPFMLAKASSTTLPYMNKTVCNSIPVISPPLELQQTFAKRIQVIDALKTQHRISQAILDALFSTLQHSAFRGEL